jgi:hypothetical protein
MAAASCGVECGARRLGDQFWLPSTDERQWMTPVKSFIWAKDAAGIRRECIEMRNRPGEGRQKAGD